MVLLLLLSPASPAKGEMNGWCNFVQGLYFCSLDSISWVKVKVPHLVHHDHHHLSALLSCVPKTNEEEERMMERHYNTTQSQINFLLLSLNILNPIIWRKMNRE
jgi:hypothetical protein